MRTMLLVCLLALAACRPAGLEPPVATDEPTPELTAIRVIVDWIIPGDEDLLAVADAIFLGEVTALSPTTFNQDSGCLLYTSGQAILRLCYVVQRQSAHARIS